SASGEFDDVPLEEDFIHFPDAGVLAGAEGVKQRIAQAPAIRRENAEDDIVIEIRCGIGVDFGIDSGLVKIENEFIGTGHVDDFEIAVVLLGMRIIGMAGALN